MNRPQLEQENKTITSHAVHTFMEPGGKKLGYLVIDQEIGGISSGGVRMVPQISLCELASLAHTMTLKYAFLKIPLGGAKAAILMDHSDPTEEEKHERIRLFSRRLIPFRQRYGPGKDMGMREKDMMTLLKAARMRGVNPYTDSAYYTALTISACAEELARFRNQPLKGSTVLIEGLGKVGSWVAALFAEKGCRIVGVSTLKGALYDPHGLDARKLRRAAQRLGDEGIHHYAGATKIAREDLFGIKADFLIPCAGSWSIHLSNANMLKVKTILCGANNPVTDRAKEVLKEREILYCPDFVCNCGGVLGSILERLRPGRSATPKLVKEIFRDEVQGLLRESLKRGRAIEEVAEKRALYNLQRMMQRGNAPMGRLFSMALRLQRILPVPEPLLKGLGLITFKRMFCA